MAVTVREKVSGSGTWWVFVNHRGKRLSKRVGDKATANKLAKEMRERLAKDDLGMVRETVPTLGNYAEKHINSPIHEWTEGTRESYGRNLASNISPYSIAKMPLNEVKLRHIKEWIGELKAKGLAKGTIQLVLAVLHGVFEAARIDEHVLPGIPTPRSG